MSQSQVSGAIKTAVTSSFWSNAAAWNGGTLPTAGDDIVIPSGITITVNLNTPIVDDISVSGTLAIQNAIGSNLIYGGNMTINTGASLVNNGGIELTTTGNTFTMNGTASYIHNPRNSSALDETIFSGSNEVFSSTSSMVINKWFDKTIPLGDANRVQEDGTPNFGNLTLDINEATPWEQNGNFMTAGITARIQGTLTVSSGTVSMDNGTGSTENLYLNDVIINGTGNIIFQSGYNRTYTLLMNNFTDISTSSEYTVIADSCFGPVVWTVNNATFNHNFYGIRGSGKEAGGSVYFTVNGNLSVGGGGFVSFVRKADAPLTINVNGSTTIAGNPAAVHFIDGNSGNFVFNTNNLTISGGLDNTFLGGGAGGGVPQFTGNVNFSVANDFVLNGGSSTTIMDSDSSTKKVAIAVGHDFIMSHPQVYFTGAYSRGAFTLRTNNDINITNGNFKGQADTNCTAIDSIKAGNDFIYNVATAGNHFRANYGNGNTIIYTVGDFTMTSSGTGNGQGFQGSYGSAGNVTFTVGGNYLQNGGRMNAIYNEEAWTPTGNFTFNVAGTFTMGGGHWSGVFNRASANPGAFSFTSMGQFLFSGGNFKGHYSSNTNNQPGLYTFNTHTTINFSAVTDTFMFLGWTTIAAVANSMTLNLTVNGNFLIDGALGNFISSVSNGNEIITINGNIYFWGGRNSFNSYPNSTLTNAHRVDMTVNGDMLAGAAGKYHITYLSAGNDSLFATVNGNKFELTSGEFAVQGGNTYANFKVRNHYYQWGGQFYLHRNTLSASYEPVVVELNFDDDNLGGFFHGNGVINFDDNPNSTQNIMYIRSTVVQLTAGSISMANPGGNAVTGIMSYSHFGFMNFNRMSPFHDIQQIEQHVATGTHMVVLNGDIQIASYINQNTNWLVVENGATLDMRLSQIKSNLSQPNSGLKVFGRLRTQRAQGLYDNTANAVFNASGNLNYFLLTNSTIEYYGVDNQVVTGVGLGQALFGIHEYYDLEINFTGAANLEYVYPTNLPTSRSVSVRNQLILTSGELNLDNDHNNASGGRSIVVRNPATNAIVRPVNGGYIRSEVIDSTASVIWFVDSTLGAHVIPFGYSATDYIPFTFNLTSGGADTLTVSTYHTNVANVPLPPSVSHLNNMSAMDNSSLTVDRFWYIASTSTGTSTANLTFQVVPSEMAGIVNPRAQHWIRPTAGWNPPYQGSQSSVANGTQVNSAIYYEDNWWTLAAFFSPLPIELMSLEAECKGEEVVVQWETASENNNDYFTVLHSRNGISYEAIGTLPGAGTTTTSSRYSFTDAYPGTMNYYKLRQTDFDGESEEFGPVAVKHCGGSDKLEFDIVSAQVQHTDLMVHVPADGRYRVDLYAIDGRLVYSMEAAMDAGYSLVSLPHRPLPKAVYMIKVAGPDVVLSKKTLLGTE